MLHIAEPRRKRIPVAEPRDLTHFPDLQCDLCAVIDATGGQLLAVVQGNQQIGGEREPRGLTLAETRALALDLIEWAHRIQGAMA